MAADGARKPFVHELAITKKEEMVSLTTRKGFKTFTPTERDRLIVHWILLHGLLTSQQIRQIWFRRSEDGVEKIASQQAVSKVMSRLVSAGLLAPERVLFKGPVVYRTTAAGARFVGSKVRPAKVDLADFYHDLAVVDLWIALVGGATGVRWVTERQIRDRLRPGMSIGRIPDGLVVGPEGERWAVELESSSKDSKRYRRIHHVYAERHRVEIPTESPGWDLGEQLDDYIGSGGKIDAVVWFFVSKRLLERAEEAARKMMHERAGSYRETRHIRMSFQPAENPGLPPFAKWQAQQRRERERQEEERRRKEAERARRELAERHARRVGHAMRYLTEREQEEAAEAAERRNREHGGYGTSRQEKEMALIDAAQAKYERQEEKEQQKQRRKDSLRRIFGGGA